MSGDTAPFVLHDGRMRAQRMSFSPPTLYMVAGFCLHGEHLHLPCDMCEDEIRYLTGVAVESAA